MFQQSTEIAVENRFPTRERDVVVAFGARLGDGIDEQRRAPGYSLIGSGRRIAVETREIAEPRRVNLQCLEGLAGRTHGSYPCPGVEKRSSISSVVTRPSGKPSTFSGTLSSVNSCVKIAPATSGFTCITPVTASMDGFPCVHQPSAIHKVSCNLSFDFTSLVLLPMGMMNAPGAIQDSNN